MSEINEKISSLRQDDNSQVQVVIKREDNEYQDELDLLHIFVNMKQKRRIYAWVIILCLVVGLTAPMLWVELKDKSDTVSAVVTFDYPGGDKFLAPGEEAKLDEDEGNLDELDQIDLNYITSSYILQNALKKTKLSENITVSSLASNLSIEKLFTEETRQALEVMSKVLEADTKAADSVMTIDYRYQDQIIITLKNGFGKKNQRRKTYLKGEELTLLLNNIAQEYSDYFFKAYSSFEVPNADIENVDFESLDYIERLDSMLEVLDIMEEFCSDAEQNEFIDYRSKLDGLSFADICECVKLVKDIDVDYLYAYILNYCAAEDAETLKAKLQYSLRNSKNVLKALKENIDTNAELIKKYKNDSILVAGADSGTAQSSSAVTDYYNDLILAQAEYYAEEADVQSKIDILNEKLAAYEGEGGSAKPDYVENRLESICNTCKKLYELTQKHAAEILSSDFYRNSLLTVISAQYDGDSIFSAATVKKSVIGGAVGLVLAVFVWCFDGLIMEFRLNGKKKEEFEALRALKASKDAASENENENAGEEA